LKAQDYRGAIEPLTNAIEYYPTNHEALSNRGLAYFYLGELDTALENLKSASELMPDNASYSRLLNEVERALAAQ
jgi:rhomboid protease GluP